jgi:solute carrier family 35 protein F1/2
LVVSVQRDLAILLTEIQEFVIKKSNRVELMAMLGLFGAIVSGIQMYPLEFTHFIIFSTISYTLLLSEEISLLLFP